MPISTPFIVFTRAGDSVEVARIVRPCVIRLMPVRTKPGGRFLEGKTNRIVLASPFYRCSVAVDKGSVADADAIAKVAAASGEDLVANYAGAVAWARLRGGSVYESLATGTAFLLNAGASVASYAEGEIGAGYASARLLYDAERVGGEGL